MEQTHSEKLKAKYGPDYFRDIRKKVKNPGFKNNPEAARKAANKRWHRETPQEEEPKPAS